MDQMKEVMADAIKEINRQPYATKIELLDNKLQDGLVEISVVSTLKKDNLYTFIHHALSVRGVEFIEVYQERTPAARMYRFKLRRSGCVPEHKNYRGLKDAEMQIRTEQQNDLEL